MRNRLLDMLGIRHPIIQAPMAGVSTPRLAAAVSEAGGLGSIAVGAGNVEQARSAVAELRSLTKGAVNVNVFAHRPALADPAIEAAWLDWLAPHFAAHGAAAPAVLREIYTSFLADQAMLALLVEQRPAVVSFHFGLPTPAQVTALRGAGITLIATATSLEEARAAQGAGMDAIVAQGIEAGGHRGVFDPAAPDEGLGTFGLVRLMARELHLPVIAAGGVMDGAGIAAALQLGAAAVQMGTAFIACPESAASAHHRAELLRPGARTALTDAVSGRPARGIVNRLFDDAGGGARPQVPDYPIAYDAAKALHAAAVAHGVQDYSVNWAGQAFALARALPAAELVNLLAAELANSLANSVPPSLAAERDTQPGFHAPAGVTRATHA